MPRRYLILYANADNVDCPAQNAYQMLYQRNLRAYGKLYRNKGAMTEGTTPEIADGMSLDKIKMIINLLPNKLILQGFNSSLPISIERGMIRGF